MCACVCFCVCECGCVFVCLKGAKEGENETRLFFFIVNA